MRAVCGVMSLLIVLFIVGVLAKSKIRAMSAAPIHMHIPALADQAVALPVTSPGATPQVQSQQQVKQLVEAAMQPRPMPGDQP